MFPITLFGSGGGEDDPPGKVTDPACVCFDDMGVPDIGYTAGFWNPARLIEIVRTPYCSPALGGITIQDDPTMMGGYIREEGDSSDGAFYHYHYYAFPLFAILELVINPECNAGGFIEFDLMYLSELEPTWNDEELSLFLTPEVAVFANPLAIASCSIDCAAATAREPTNSMFWCAGCWGNLYPFTGHIASDGSPPRDTSLLATRSVAALHRRGLAHKTYGLDALCGGSIFPMIPKEQYKMSLLYPLGEAEPRCCHWIGESTFGWGEWRNLPAVGEDFVYMLWRYTDCCMH